MSTSSELRSARGSISAFVVCSVMTLVCLAGLAFDGGRVVATYTDVSDVVQNAARMGDQFLVGIREGRPRIDAVAGSRAVREFLLSRGLAGDVFVEGRTVTVTVRRRIPMRILGLFGISHREISVTRRAELVDG